ncbi:cytokinin dehydrogenase 6 [Cinnamomum micranthum f. kanehirae]|uniref:cytokinin dehydrogenase n=1 Tax=Cinnamomum micranthum f. kanehirae TaxID=337451 RepID=A0A3S3PRM0_9MAGN|nr:cytokinin dehydrogenase 6 [Cinnamomum micranthum f. kanehirae]
MVRTTSILSIFFIVLAISPSIFTTREVIPNTTSLPPFPRELFGKIRVDPNSTNQASTDFGNITRAIPAAVLYPTSVNDIALLIQASYSSSNPFKIAARGRAHSTHGQALVLDGVVIQMSSLNYGGASRIDVSTNPHPYYFADVGGEQLWIDVLRATLLHGLTPVSWTDYLDLTVGGTLSNAGISGQAFRHGPQISNVYELDVVTRNLLHYDARYGYRTGEILTCSQQVNSELYYGVLGGLGQFGIITRARIALGQAPERVRWLRLIYGDLMKFTKDQEYLISLKGEDMSRGSFDYVEGTLVNDANLTTFNFWASFFSKSELGRISVLTAQNATFYCLEVVKYYKTSEASNIDQDVASLLKQLSFLPGYVFPKDVTYTDFLYRVHQEEEKLRAQGLWEIPHPRLNLFLPKSSIVEFDHGVFKSILKGNYETMGGLILIYPMIKHKWDERTSAAIPEEEIFYTVGLLRFATNQADLKYLEDQNREILNFCNGAGIKYKQYLSYIEDNAEWKKQLGEKWDIFYQRKMSFDPKEILSPGQNIFTP